MRQPFRKPDGAIGYRCAGEPADDYVQKGGKREDTIGRKCLCNGLMATVGLGQERAGGTEDPIITAGDDVANLARFLPANRDSYGAAEVIRWLLRQPLPA